MRLNLTLTICQYVDIVMMYMNMYLTQKRLLTKKNHYAQL